MGKVTKSYLVCATPRSGSTLLCALLEGTGVAGRPRSSSSGFATGLPRQPREYFERVEDPELLELLAPTDPGAPDRGDPIPGALERGTTDNGVFAAKLMWTHLLDLAERLGRPADAALLASGSRTRATSTSRAATRSPRRSRCGARCRPAPGAPVR